MIFVMGMNAKFAIKRISGMAEPLAIFSKGVPQGGANENPRASNLFRLVGMQHRHIIEGAI